MSLVPLSIPQRGELEKTVVSEEVPPDRVVRSRRGAERPQGPSSPVDISPDVGSVGTEFHEPPCDVTLLSALSNHECSQTSPDVCIYAAQ